MEYGKEIKRELAALGSDKLAEVLSNLANRSDKADEVVFQLLASKKEKLKRFKSKLAGLKQRNDFISWRESSGFAHHLESLLNDLREAVDDPKKGVEYVIKFYETDEAIFEYCDDSSGNIGDVFHCDALDMFVSYASKCEDKEWIASEVERVVANDGYGVRDQLVDRATEYLPQNILRSMVKRFRERFANSGDWHKNSWRFMAESMAKQLKDVDLYENIALDEGDVLSDNKQLEIANIHFGNGDYESTLKRLNTISRTSSLHTYNDLLLKTHRKLGNQGEVVKILQQEFNAYSSVNTLDALLKEIGLDKREELLNEAEKKIVKKSRFSVSNVDFFVETGRIGIAGEYILARNTQIDGESYYALPVIAKKLVKSNMYLPAVVIYRALLEANVAKALSKYYRHGIRYLKELDKISPKVENWKHISHHTDYFAKFSEKHARKSAFWGKYDI